MKKNISPNNPLCELTLENARNRLINKDFSSSELVEAHIAQVENIQDLNLFITTNFDEARIEAKQADARIAKGEALPLDGLPIANKDLFCTKDILTTAGSKILNNFIPPYESTITKALKSAGAVSLGKLNLDEFAMGSANQNPHYGNAINPWGFADGKNLTPGGSSGGSAALVAARGALATSGTDTGGSIRQPASFCGIVGMKPTYGRCSRFGIIAFASSLDQAGPFTRTVKDNALMLSAMAGHDANDSTSANIENDDYYGACGGSIKGMRIGIPEEWRKIDSLQDDVATLWDEAAKSLEQAGANLVSISLKQVENALSAYYIIAPAEASSNLARYDGVRYGYRAANVSELEDLYMKTRGEGFGAEVKRRIMIGTYVLSAGYYDAYYKKAQKVRHLIASEFQQAFEICDAILTPTTTSPAFAHDKSLDPVSMYYNDIYTVPVNLAGLPAISLPTGLDHQGLPLGMQLIGRAFDEQSLYKIAYALEAETGFDASPFEKRNGGES